MVNIDSSSRAPVEYAAPASVSHPPTVAFVVELGTGHPTHGSGKRMLNLAQEGIRVLRYPVEQNPGIEDVLGQLALTLAQEVSPDAIIADVQKEHWPSILKAGAGIPLIILDRQRSATSHGLTWYVDASIRSHRLAAVVGELLAFKKTR